MESRSQSDDNSMTSLYLMREKGKEDKRVSSSSRVSISKRDLYIVWLRLLRINHVDFSRSGLSISHHHRQRKSILSLSFLFFPTQAFVQSRYKKKRVCPGLRLRKRDQLFLYINAYVQKNLHRFSSSSSKASPNLLLHPGALSLAKEEEKERDTARARATTKRERYKKNREKDPQNREKNERRDFLT